MIEIVKPIKKLVYLASPYKHDDPKVVVKRYKDAAKTAGIIMNKLYAKDDMQYWVYSPIAHTHSVSKFAKIEPFTSLWYDFGMFMVAKCDELWVLDIEGWRESKGVQEEIKEAYRLGIPVKLVTKRGVVKKIREENEV